MLLEGLIHDFRHGQLRRTKFVSRVPALQNPASPEDPLDRHILGFCSSSSFFRHRVRWHSQEWPRALNFKILHASRAARCGIEGWRLRPAGSFANHTHLFVPPPPYVLM